MNVPLSMTADNPFRDINEPSGFFSSRGSYAAELKLGYVVEQDQGLGVLVGEPGLGKSSLLRRLVAEARAAEWAVADVFFPRLGVEELLGFLAAEFAPAQPLPSSAGRDERLRRLAARLTELSADGGAALIVVDDAHLVRRAAFFETLLLLMNLRQRNDVRLTVVLAGTPALLADIARVPAFAQRVAVTAVLAPLDSDETTAFIRHRLTAAGHSPETFTDSAVAAIYEESVGVLRTINRLCEMSLLVSLSEGRNQVTTDDVQTVAAETRLLAAC